MGVSILRAPKKIDQQSVARGLGVCVWIGCSRGGMHEMGRKEVHMYMTTE